MLSLHYNATSESHLHLRGNSMNANAHTHVRTYSIVRAQRASVDRNADKREISSILKYHRDSTRPKLDSPSAFMPPLYVCMHV